MNGWLDGIRRILERAPTRALPFTGILEELRREGTPVGNNTLWLLEGIRKRDDLFRVIQAGRGPWSPRTQDLHSFPGRSVPPSLDPNDTWILLRDKPVAGYGHAEALVSRIRDGIVAWGLEMDDAAPASAARWIRANQEGIDACRVILGQKKQAA